MATLVTEKELRQCVDIGSESLNAVRAGFEQLAAGRATIPPIMGLEIPERNGAADVKAAYISGWDSFAIKLSTRFFDNARRGISTGSGMMVLIDSDIGKPVAIMLDNGYLTTVRTALAGALAAEYLSPESIQNVAVIGSGSQAWWQLRALSLVREFGAVSIYGRDAERARQYAERVTATLGVAARAVGSAEEAVRGAQVILTTTPAREPVVKADWVQAGAHVTAMGSDAPHKNELEPDLLAKADRLVCDLTSQCLRRGELRHAVEAGAVNEDKVTELGDIIGGNAPGREGNGQTTVCDLTGVGVQDTAIARWALEQARAADLGREID